MSVFTNNSTALSIPPLTFPKSLPPKHQLSFPPISLRSFFRLPHSAALSGSRSGGDNVLYGSGGSGDGGRETKWSSVVSAGVSDLGIADEAADVIVLNVTGMSCDGCAASVKRILENQPQVLQATVSFEKEQAVIWVVPEAKLTENWQQEMGEKLAIHLTTFGFKSDLQEVGRTA